MFNYKTKQNATLSSSTDLVLDILKQKETNVEKLKEEIGKDGNAKGELKNENDDEPLNKFLKSVKSYDADIDKLIKESWEQTAADAANLVK